MLAEAKNADTTMKSDACIKESLFRRLKSQQEHTEGLLNSE